MIPFSVARYGTFLREAFAEVETRLGPRLRQNGVTLGQWAAQLAGLRAVWVQGLVGLRAVWV